MKIPTFAILAIATLLAATSAAAADSGPSPESLRKFESQRFGMFIHWGPVSLTGYELGWSRGNQTPAAEYDQLYHRFNPVRFDADQWVRIAKDAGMRYVVLTAKHMDGFCLWDTHQTDYNIMNSAFKRDIVAEMSRACARGGMDFGAYYCIADWYSPWYPFFGPYKGPTQTPRKPTTDPERYNLYVMKQVAELIGNYGPLECLWFDSMTGGDSEERGRRLVSFARAMQPNILINNRSGVPGDYVTPEERIGRYRDDRPWESCMMIGTQWSWKPNDALKSFPQLLRALVYCSGGDGNLLLDVGPRADGTIEPRTVARLREIGDWLGRYGESIYDTRGGPYKPTSYLASTRRGNFVYLHIIRWFDGPLVVPALPGRIVAATLLTGGTVRASQADGALTVDVAPADRQRIDTLVRLEMDRPAATFAPIALPREVTITASATMAPEAQHSPAFAADNDPETEWSAPEGQTTGSLELNFVHPRTIRAIKLEEKARPHLMQSFDIARWDQGKWVTLAAKTVPVKSVGPDYSVDFPPVTIQRLRVRILKSKGTAALTEVVITDVDP